MDKALTRFSLLTLVAAITAGAACTTMASSEQAWQTFRADVQDACRAAAEGAGFQVETVTVDPFGSQHYGLARLIGHENGQDRQQLLCAYDKHSRQAEVGTPMALDPDVRP